MNDLSSNLPRTRVPGVLFAERVLVLKRMRRFVRGIDILVNNAGGGSQKTDYPTPSARGEPA